MLDIVHLGFCSVVRLTRGRSPVQAWPETSFYIGNVLLHVPLFFFFIISVYFIVLVVVPISEK